MDPKKPLQHQQPTKELISRYEFMSSSRHPPVSQNSLDDPANTSLPGLKKEKSPIRRSFYSLVSALKKVNLRKGKQIERPLSSFRRQHPPALDDHPGLSAPPVLRSRSRKLASSLLHLSRTPLLLTDSSDLKPVWTSCTATLEPDTIVVVGRTPHGNPSAYIIELSNCTDVRSLSLQQLDSNESAMLPRKGEHDEFKVFEILFEGRPREKFAANSVQERAGWVSAIWDTILAAQDNQTANILGNSQPSGNLGNQEQLPTTAVPEVASFLHRALPPIPTDPISLLSTRRILSADSRTRDSPSTSPSIANLSQLSVVRQRLAQLETFSSRSSGESPTPSSRSSAGASLTTPVQMEPVLPKAMARDRSGRSSVTDSILDSYGDYLLNSAELASIPVFPTLPEDVTNIETRGIVESLGPSCYTHRRTRHAPTTLHCGLEPVIELLQDESSKSYDQTNNLDDQSVSLQSEVQRLPTAIASVMDTEGHTNTVLKMVAKLEEQASSNRKVLGSIDSKIDKFAAIQIGSRTADDTGKLAKAIQTLRTDVMGDLTHIRSVLDAKHDATSLIDIKSVASSAPQPEVDSISRLHTKVDGLLAACSGEHTSSATAIQVEESLNKIVSLAEKDSRRQDIQAQQQSETVRYLTELNSWIEALISHDTAQRHNLSIGIDQFCRDLNGAEGGSTLVADIRQLAQSTVVRDHNSTVLQASVNELSALVDNNSVESSVARIATLLEHQRQYQEDLVRTLGVEITDEIKGERLRFVEAMKEATAINVQIHVEQFKQELKCQVVEMTEEVGRLHQDRQAMQNQIADLFAFYRAQKAAVEQVSITTI
ncbi:hypothetical protein C0991_011421 [Blastosporella zonata]|nr:hypothetical protein C0991_011421 [Blastosporella zonata]